MVCDECGGCGYFQPGQRDCPRCFGSGQIDGSADRCDLCGAELQVGQWPFCHGDPSQHVDAKGFGDAPLEPYIDEHIAPAGTEVGYDSEGNPYRGHLITTRGQRRALMSKGHIDYLDVSSKKRGRVYVCLGGK